MIDIINVKLWRAWDAIGSVANMLEEITTSDDDLHELIKMKCKDLDRLQDELLKQREDLFLLCLRASVPSTKANNNKG